MEKKEKKIFCRDCNHRDAISGRDKCKANDKKFCREVNKDNDCKDYESCGWEEQND